MNNRSAYTRILAIDPYRRGFGFAVLEGQRRLLDWGTARVWSRNDKEFLVRIECLSDRYRVRALVLPDPSDYGRSPRAARRTKSALAYGRERGLCTVVVSNRDVRQAFAAAGPTKHEIASGIAGLFPELEPHLPPRRKPWVSEDERMNVFTAVGRALSAVWGESSAT
jgi:hypothetical protein